MVTRRHFVVCWLPALLWMAVIFTASGDTMSGEHSSRIIGPLVRWLMPSISDASLGAVILAVRKVAHLLEYALLAWLLWRAIAASSGTGAARWSWRTAIRALLLVMLYAASDEFHQMYVPARQASVLDVLIDTAGGILGLIFVWILGRWRHLW